MTPSIRLAIVGDRHFTDYVLFKAVLAKVNSHIRMIVSGGAKGADTLAEKYANEQGIALQVFQADWDKYGKSAGNLRNEEIVEIADAMIAFLDKRSKGTKNSIYLAHKKGIPVHVVHV